MSVASTERFHLLLDECLDDLHQMIDEDSLKLSVMLTNAPTSFRMMSGSKTYDTAWEIGFKRCLAELRRLAEKQS